jgi:transposase InsO family protein
MTHPRARLSVFGRQLLVARVTELGWSPAMAANALGVSRATAYKWLRRHRLEGNLGLLDRSSRPHRSPRRLPDHVEAGICRARAERRYGPHRLAPLTGVPRSTIYAVLRRRGLSRLRDADRVSAAPVRYVACHPGALLHQDHKKLGRIPDGGGHRIHGRGYRPGRLRGLGYDHFEVVIDDASRVGLAMAVPDESAASASLALETAAAFFATLGVRIERVMTDNGFAYRSRAYATVLDELGARHKRTRPFRPQTNGKAERFIQTLLHEWAYGRPYVSNAERLAALQEYLDFYNHGRSHTALGGLTPMQVLVNNVPGKHS